ncbi:Lambda phage tail tape-measure protein (Tape-meas-lam-C) [Bradyrhizobium sp. YR681]|uniref:phage tail tape measure protein n=1 Tax=Bradyrhizobium sp. YR681 TaxID=1144344 RepID=UPI000270DED7|nr:phage tail tape measure protein [Bradyrhizobium sp. YR681]EJN15686.1 Lambda phage tail tape-measure protein (Tape-meas-lam-C) [Bradyrhizobium sp. YR681]
MSQVVTELVIDADTSGADQFTRAMDGAANAAQRGVEQTSGLNINLIALGAGALGAAAAAKQILDQVAEANKALADMAGVADRVGLSLRDFQGVKLEGAIKGLADGQINAGLEKSAELLNDAGRNANSLSKVFDENGVSLRNSNGQLISQNQLLQVAADLVSRARNPQDAIALAQMLGFTKEWVPLLQEGSAAMRDLGDRAQDAGALIDDETIHRAQEFDAKWRQNSAEFSAYMKSALYGLMPLVDDLIEGASKFVKSIDRAKIIQASDESFKKFNEATGIPESGVISIDAEKLVEAGREFQRQPVFSTETWVNFGKSVYDGFKFRSAEEAARDIPGFAASLITEPSYPTAAQMDAAFDKWSPPDPGSRARPLPGLTAADYGQDSPSRVPSREQSADAVDRAIASLTRHTAVQEADAKAVGLGAAALAGYRAEAAESAAVLANGGKETAAQAKAFADLRERAMAAADALARAKVEGRIDFGAKTMFLSQEDVAIANQLKDIYGNDVPKALNSTFAAAMRTQDAMRQLSSSIENSLVSGLTDIASGAKTAGQGFQDMANSIVRAIEQMIIKLLIVEPLMRSVQGFAGGIFGGGGGLPGTEGSPYFGPVAPSANGNVFSSGAIVPFAMGGIPDVVSSPTIAPMAMFGEAGDEAIMPLRRGADGRLGVSGGGSAPMQVNVTLVENPNAQGGVTQRQNDNGGLDIEIAVAQIAAKSAATPGGAVNRVMTDQLGARQTVARR